MQLLCMLSTITAITRVLALISLSIFIEQSRILNVVLIFIVQEMLNSFNIFFKSLNRF